MKQFKRLAPLRAIGAIAAILVLVSGVTFAALRSQDNQLNGSRMSSATANLLMSQNPADGWFNTMNGFDFFELIPGGDPGPATGNNLYLRNDGTTTLAIQMALNPSRIFNPNQVDLSKAKVVLVDDHGVVLASPTLAELYDAYTTRRTVTMNVSIPAFTTQRFMLQMQLGSDSVMAVNTQASIEYIDLVISGTAQTT